MVLIKEHDFSGSICGRRTRKIVETHFYLLGNSGLGAALNP
jgi:hypothetical protein